jgi:coenzyme F420-reducing hydrogenase beta subunit
VQHFPELAAGTRPRLSPDEIIRSGLCIGCGSCAAREKRGAMGWDRDGFLKPQAPKPLLRARTGGFAATCPFSPHAADEDAIARAEFPSAPSEDVRIGRFHAAYVGHVAEGEWRRQGSSGGLVSWVAAELLRTGAVDGVAHVRPTDPRRGGRLFAYALSRSVDEIAAGAKSRYYPVDLSSVLQEMGETPGRYAVVGVPCFIKAVHLARRADRLLAERITHTLGLFCGHQKSARMVQSFAWQLGADGDAVRAIDYRRKDETRPANWYRAELQLADGSSRAEDWWHFADGDWGAGFFQNPACNFCDDVVGETAGISFGDAWLEPYASDGRGTNVVVVRDASVRDMIERARADGRLDLQPVDANFVAATQAAGLRHRREGLAYRLAWMRRRPVRPRKRVGPKRDGLPLRRRLVYRLRAGISGWSLRAIRLADRAGMPALYTGWARPSVRLYQALAWSHGPIGRLIDVLLPPQPK